jgi:hypothetical protein
MENIPMHKRIIILVLLAILVSACTGQPPSLTQATAQAPTASDTPSPTVAATQPPTLTSLPTATEPPPTLTITASPTPYSAGPEDFPPAVNPLTGLAVSDPNTLNRRPMSVKVQLYPRSQRPVWGVSLADLVFDYYQNNGLTRLNAIFYGNDAEQIGPIRSARLFDENIIRMYKAYFAFGGAAQYVLNRLYNGEYADRLVTEGYGNCPPMCRSDPNGFNFLFTSTTGLTLKALEKGLPQDRPNLDGMFFSSLQPDVFTQGSSLLGEQVVTRYSISAYNRWEYDPASGSYARFQDTQEDDSGQGEAFTPLIDGLTGQQIRTANLVVIFLPHQPAELSGSSQAVDVRLEESGLAYAFRDGKAYKVTWKRADKESVLSLSFEDGQPYPFKPGNTWFQVVGLSTQFTNPTPGAWRFVSQLP